MQPMLAIPHHIMKTLMFIHRFVISIKVIIIIVLIYKVTSRYTIILTIIKAS